MRKALFVLLLFTIVCNLFAQENKYTAEDYSQMSIASVRAKDYDMA